MKIIFSEQLMDDKKVDVSDDFNNDEIDLIELVKPIVYHWKVLVFVPILGVIFFTAYYKLAVKPTYSSSADILVMGNALNDTYSGNATAAQLYKKILESPSIKDKVLNSVLLDVNSKNEVTFKVNLFTKKRAQDQLIVPVINLQVDATKPQVAFQAVNLWIKLFFNTVADLEKETSSDSLTVVEEKFKESKDSLKKITTLIEETKIKFNKKVADENEKFIIRLNKFNEETAELINKLEARRAKERANLAVRFDKDLINLKYLRAQKKADLLMELKPDVASLQQKKLSDNLSSLKTLLSTVDFKIALEEKTVKQLEDLLAETTPKLVLKTKAIISSKKEIINPEYSAVQSSLLQHRLELENLKLEKENAKKALTRLTETYENIIQSVSGASAKLSKFDSETNNAIDDLLVLKNNALKYFDKETNLMVVKIQNKREFEKQKMQNRFNEITAKIKAEQSVALKSLNTEHKFLNRSLDLVINKYKNLSYASVKNLSVKVMVEPTLPNSANAVPIFKKVFAVYVLLMFLSLCYIYLSEFWRHNKNKIFSVDSE
jgi:capsular polysaccharide biosynthesis protein